MRPGASLLLLLPIALAAQQPIQVAVEPDTVRGETVYRAADGDCQISWTVFHTELNRGIVQHRATCSSPLDRQLPLLRAVLAKVIADDTAHEFRSIFIGRLDAFPEMSVRLAQLAKRSPDWDVRSGRPARGPMNRVIAALANRGPIYTEWQQLFREFERRIEVSAVEKVSVSPAGRIAYYNQLRAAGIPSTDKLPYDCLLWFSVTRLAGAPR